MNEDRVLRLIGFSVLLVLIVSSGVRAQSTFPWLKEPAAPNGFNREKLRETFAQARRLAPLNSLLIARNGTLVAEAYYRDMGPHQPVNIKSASKSIISALVGIAIQDGHLEGLNQPIGPFFLELLKNRPRKQAITLRNLLLMRSGLKPTSFEAYGAWVTSDNWIRYALHQPLVSEPGTETSYSTGNSHIVAVVLARAVDQDLRQYARRNLFDPLGVDIKGWQRDPQGYRFGGNNLALTPRGFLRFGQLYLNDGQYNGRRIVPEKWVEKSTRPYVYDTYHGYPYGYFWWLTTYHDRRVVFAWGHGGQYVFIVPDLKLVVACTSDRQLLPEEDEGYTEKIHTLLRDRIIPAVKP